MAGYWLFTMKKIPLLVLGMAIPAFAGSPAEVAPAAAPEPCLFTWFTGASVGYLTEFEEPMYHFHAGTDTCWNLGGWNVALFAEIGYTEKDDSWSGRREYDNGYYPRDYVEMPTNGGDYEKGSDNIKGNLDELEEILSNVAKYEGYNTGYDLDIMPITLNVKLERPLTDGLNVYFGAGLGAALVDLEIDAGKYGSLSDDDWIFVGQVFAGLTYNFNPNFEVYGGARWIYYDDAEMSDSAGKLTLELEDDFLFEIGARFNF